MTEGTTRLIEGPAARAASRAARLGLTAQQTLPLEPASSAPPDSGSSELVTVPDGSAFDVDIEQLPRVAIDGLDDYDDAPTGADLLGLSTLGQGGMGRVLLARQRSLSREVAVKVLNEGAEAHGRSALLREGRITGSLEHPGIIPVHALGVDAHGRPLLVMKRVDGVDWETLLQDPTHGAWSARLAANGDRLEANLEILLRICQTLEFAHSRGVIHRDLKPANVMVGAFGEVYLVDWGIAVPARSQDGTIVGTPAYMAPEMVACEPVDERTDVYLLGAVLHRVLTGQARHTGASLHEVVVAAAFSEPFTYPQSVPSWLAELCNRATSAERASRPQTALAFREELLAFMRYRSAFMLSDAALTRLAVLERMLADGGERAPQDLARAYRLGTEARFGFTQCLRSYPEHTPAREGVRQCLSALIELELRQGHVDSAAAVLAELEDPPATLVRRVEEARADARRAAMEHARLRAMDRDLDPSVAKGGRSLAFGAMLLAGTTITGVATIRQETFEPGSLRLVAYAAVLLGFSLGIVGLFRRPLLANTFNRRFTSLLLLVVTMMLLNRVVSSVSGVRSEITLSNDLVVMIGGTAAGALLIHARSALAIAPLLLGLAALHAFPEHYSQTFGASTTVCFAACVWAVWRGSERAR